MQRSNTYILIYTIILTVFCGISLSLAKQALKPAQDEQIELQRKRNILSTFMTLEKTDDVNAIYTKRVKEYVINAEGQTLEGVSAGSISVEKESKKPVAERQLPVYEILKEGSADETEFYVVATFGKGLWDVISSYISIRSDGTTINGVVFNHKAETPGLGARIKDDEAVYSRYAGKELFDNGKPVGVIMMKGEGNNYDGEKHKVDGMSGATLTGKGVNKMIIEYTEAYAKFLQSKSAGKETSPATLTN
ncbi:MAG: NADH:ubiquinone reductase (Na(+)-transporting) subunit C [Bacteroidia bacterium]